MDANEVMRYGYLVLFAFGTALAQQNVGIGTSTPDPSALLHLESTSKGLLIPRMTQAQRNAIGSPATGLMIYQTDNNPGFYYWNGTAWIPLLSSTSGSGLFWSLTGNSGTNPATNFLGTTDAQPLILRTNTTGYPTGGYLQLSADGRGRLEFLNAGASVLIGEGAGAGTDFSAPRYSVMVGYNAGAAQTTGQFNTGIGAAALLSLTTGSDNTAVGMAALYSTTVGEQNTAVGRSALEGNQTGAANTAVGYRALEGNVGGSYNTALGAGATVGASNLTNATAIGSWARVDVSNALVLGSVAGVNGAPATVNVGIGTTAPTNRLHVVATSDPLRLEGIAVDAAQDTVLVVTSSGVVKRRSLSEAMAGTAWSLAGNAVGSAWNGTTGSFLGTTDVQPLVIATTNTTSPQPIQFWTGNQERMRITAAGNVGIGVSTPLARLQTQTLSPTGATEAIFGWGNQGISLMSRWPTVGFNAYYDYGASTWRSLDAGWTGNISQDQTDGKLRFETGSASVAGAGQSVSHTVRMVITPTGRVGIGTDNPLQALHVVGSAYVSQRLGIGVASPSNVLEAVGNYAVMSNPSGSFQLALSKNTASATASVLFQTNYSGRAEFGMIGDENFRLKVSPDGSTFYEAIFIANSSTPLVGIGTTAPTNRLHVVASSNPLRLEGLQTDNTLTQVLVADASGVVKVRSASTLVSGTAWSLTGNSGTNPATNFLGTTDAQPLVVRVNNQETFRFNAPGTVAPGWSLQRGGGNTRGLHAVDLQSARSAATQVASGDYSVISGGSANTANGQYSTVGGGFLNTASGGVSTVGGGYLNTASGGYSTVGGGQGNTASGQYSTVGGGLQNTASGQHSAIPGGYNLRVGAHSFGFSGQTSATQTDLSNFSSIAAFVDVDLWLYSVRNQASQLRLYEASAHSSGQNFVGFRAPNSLTGNTLWTLPPSDGTPGQALVTDGSGQLSWSHSPGVVLVRKTGDESVNSTTLQDDDHLTVSLPANSVWEVDALLFVYGSPNDNNNGGIQVRLSAPTGTTMQVYVEIKKGGSGSDLTHHWFYGVLTSPSSSVGFNPIPTAATGTGAVKLKGLVFVGSTSGNLVLQWAKNATAGNATTVWQNSYMKLTRVQ